MQLARDSQYVDIFTGGKKVEVAFGARKCWRFYKERVAFVDKDLKGLSREVLQQVCSLTVADPPHLGQQVLATSPDDHLPAFTLFVVAMHVRLETL